MTLVGSILLHHAHPTYVSFAEDPHFPPVSFSYVPSTSPTCMAMGMKARQLPPPYRFFLNLPTCMKKGQVLSPTPFICPRSSSRPWTDSPCYNPLVTKCQKRGYLFGRGGKRWPFFSYLKGKENINQEDFGDLAEALWIYFHKRRERSTIPLITLTTSKGLEPTTTPQRQKG